MESLRVEGCFNNENEKKLFVENCEKAFEAQLDGVCDKIHEISEKNKIFTLSGPTCSGKTTTAKKIVSTLSGDGKKVKVISLDDFFVGRVIPHDEAVRTNTKVDYDSIRSVDLPFMTECLHDIGRGKTVKLPLFDFGLGKRIGYEELDPGNYDFILFEGIHAVYPEVTRILREYGDYSVFISVNKGIETKGTFFSPEELRFLRRLVRDCKFRGSSPDFTFYYWETVTENEKENIIPNIDTQDIKMDSVMPYELGMIKPFAKELLGTVQKDNRYYTESVKILEKLEPIEEISSYLPENSMYREFLG